MDNNTGTKGMAGTNNTNTQEKSQPTHTPLDSLTSVEALPTPLIFLWEKILLIPLVGIIDSSRAKRIEEEMLAKIQELDSRICILDVRSLPILDTSITSHLTKMVKIARFMGCEVILSGVNPKIAEQMARLEVANTDFKSFLLLLDALNYALDKFGFEVTKKEK